MIQIKIWDGGAPGVSNRAWAPRRAPLPHWDTRSPTKRRGETCRPPRHKWQAPARRSLLLIILQLTAHLDITACHRYDSSTLDSSGSAATSCASRSRAARCARSNLIAAAAHVLRVSTRAPSPTAIIFTFFVYMHAIRFQ